MGSSAGGVRKSWRINPVIISHLALALNSPSV